jgi:hypothetical protein
MYFYVIIFAQDKVNLQDLCKMINGGLAKIGNQRYQEFVRLEIYTVLNSIK